MPAQQIRQRKQLPVKYNENNPVSEKLKLGFVYRELYFDLTGAVNISGAGTSAPESPEKVIRRLEIVADGNVRLRVIDGPALRDLTKTFFNTFGERTVIDPTSATEQSFRSFLILPIWMPHSMRPIDTALDSSRLSSLEVNVTWGNISDVVGDATATWSSEPELKIRSLESFGVLPPGNNWRSYYLRQTIDSANSAHQIPLTIGAMYRGFHLRTTVDGVPARSVLNNLKLVSGSEVYFDIDEFTLANVNAVRKDLDSINSGYYFIDMVTDGYVTESIDTLGFSEIYLEADVNAPGSNRAIEVWPQEFVPVRGG